jgi:hypothetical protein
MRFKNLFTTHLEYLRFCLRQRFVKVAHFFLFVLLIYILIEWQHEDNLYKNIGKMAELKASSKVDTAIVKSAMISINDIMTSRHELFRGHEKQSWKQGVFQSADIDLMYGSGACGGYSKVLARTLQLQGFKVRIGQLKTLKFGYGGHIIIEFYSKTLHKWVFIDPLFKLVVRQKNGDWASVKDVSKNYNLYSDQFPEEFNQKFKFNDVRYTNWTKWGGLSKPYYYLAKLFKGEQYANTICLRMYSLSSFPLLFWSVTFGYLTTLGIGYWRWKRR